VLTSQSFAWKHSLPIGQILTEAHSLNQGGK
jgi:hypothetical protein